MTTILRVTPLRDVQIRLRIQTLSRVVTFGGPILVKAQQHSVITDVWKPFEAYLNGLI